MKLNKYSEELTTYRKQGGLPQGEVKNALADIYEELWPNNKNWGPSKVNRNCASCVGDMMKSLCSEWESSLKEFKGVPVEVQIVEVNNELDEDINQYASQLPWGELRKFATEAGINTKGKTKADILKDLKDVD